MTKDEAKSLVGRAIERGWLPARKAAKVLDKYLAAFGSRESAPGIDLVFVRGRLLSPDRARELMGLPCSPSIHDYHLIKELGVGPHGRTVLVQHPTSCDRLAVKILHRELSVDADYVAELGRRSYIAQRVPHQVLPRPTGSGRDGDDCYYVAAYIAGVPLSEFLAKRHVFRPRVAVGHLYRIVSGLAAAGERGLTHGHLTADSIILAEDGTVRLTGLGMVRRPPALIDSGAAGLGIYHPRYLSPEHFLLARRGGPALDCRADIFSLGVVLYEMLTGRYPFMGEAAPDIYRSIRHDAPEDPSALNGSVPRELSDVVAGMLDADPERRYQTYRELLADLRDLRSSPLPDVGPVVSVAEDATGRVGYAGGVLIRVTLAAVFAILTLVLMLALFL